MINGFGINGAEINGSGSSTQFLRVDGALPQLTGTITLRPTQATGVSNGILPALSGEVYGGAILQGSLPRLAGQITVTVDTLLRVDGVLPALSGQISGTAEQALLADGDLPALIGQMLGGAILQGTLPKLGGQITLTVSRLLRADGALPALSGEIRLSHENSLIVDGVLPALVAGYSISRGALPALTGTIVFSAEQARELIAYAMNLANGAMTPYENFPFQFIARFRGKSYGFDSSGGYRLEGETDNGVSIDSFIRLPGFDFGSNNLKHVPYVYITSKSPDPLIVEAEVDDDEAAAVGVETLMVRRTKRAKFPRGLKGSVWSHKISNVGGSRLDIDSIEILPDVKRRKV